MFTHFLGLWLFMYSGTYFLIMWQWKQDAYGNSYKYWNWFEFMLLGGFYRGLMATAFTSSFFLMFG